MDSDKYLLSQATAEWRNQRVEMCGAPQLEDAAGHPGAVKLKSAASVLHVHVMGLDELIYFK